ncbi:MAG TPA: hypothetical protein VK658_24135 [Chryseolinea sp.]|nr:hypothetical protein [Chryseolinea sp.]
MQSTLKHLLLVFLVVISFASQAQQQAEMADTMRSNGKIYVVVGIILIIIAGLFVYLFSLDKKVSRLEKSITEKPRKTK